MADCGCPTRSHLYRRDCERCQARMLARVPSAMIGDVWRHYRSLWDEAKSNRMRDLVREERAADEERGHGSC